MGGPDGNEMVSYLWSHLFCLCMESIYEYVNKGCGSIFAGF